MKHRCDLRLVVHAGLTALLCCLTYTATAQASPQNNSPTTTSQAPIVGSGAPPDASATQPVTSLQVTTHHVVVDVVATDKRGRPVRDMTQNDFELHERVGWVGRTQEKIASFRLVDMTAPQPAPPQVEELVRTPQGSYSNLAAVRDPSTPLTVLLMDELNTNMFEPDIRKQVTDLADTLQSSVHNVPIAVLVLSSNLVMLQDFTENDSQVRSAIRKLMSAGPYREFHYASVEGASPQMQRQFGVASSSSGLPTVRNWDRLEDANNQDIRIQMTLNALRAIARHLAGYPGRKKLVWVSGSFPFSIVPDASGSDMAQSYRDQIAEVTNALSAARVAVYPIQPGGIWMPDVATAARQDRPTSARNTPQSAYGEELIRQSAAQSALTGTMDEVAVQTGGTACVNANDIGLCFKKALSDGYTYYELGYYPPPQSWTAGFHRIVIKTKRAGIHLSYRRSYYVERNSGKLLGQGANAADRELRTAACDDLMAATGVPVTVSPLAFTDNTARFLVRLGGSAILNATQPDATGKVHLEFEFASCIFDGSGKRLQYSQFPADYDLSPEEYIKATRQGFQQVFNLHPDPRMKLVRWLVRDPQTGLLGSVDLPWNPQRNAQQAVNQVATAQLDQSVDLAALPTNPAITAPPNKQSEASLPTLTTDKDIASYCDAISRPNPHAEALASVCAYAFSLTRKLPNLMCQRNTKRFWRNNLFNSRDEIKTKVIYQDGIEYDSDILAESKRPGFRRVGSTGSSGEFAAYLQAIFSPRTTADFQYKEETTLDSVPALLFTFNVDREYNYLYYLQATFLNGRSQITYPGYRGQLWIDKSNFRLLRLVRETTDVQSDFPINYASTIINYSDVGLGDGTRFVLPVKADAVTCSPGEGKECAHNFISYSNYHKFRATTRILTDADPPEPVSPPPGAKSSAAEEPPASK